MGYLFSREPGIGFVAMMAGGLPALPWSLAVVIFSLGDGLTLVVIWGGIAMNAAFLAYICWGKAGRKSPDVISGLAKWRRLRPPAE